ncbi:MAG: beta-galactosidase [Abditibacteriota bacterium]|nr:beta-galactosidase [Abditibacteriota bacterium]
MQLEKVFGSNFNTKEALKKIKEYGFTSTEAYVFWNRIEPEKGKFDFSYYDEEVKRVKDAGLKWLPFVLVGPNYAAPQWRLKEETFVPLVCLEHNKECPIESIWNLNLREHITRVLEAICDHYGPWDVIEAVMPGISGDYGEAIFPVHGNWPGVYHGHSGYWAGDPLAMASFQVYLKEKYKTIDALNKAHRESYDTWDEVRPKLAHKCNRSAFLDMVLWYKQSMTDYADFWMGECRRIFGADMSLYLCTGGCEQPYHGSDFAAQARVCAKHGAGLRLTNEVNKFYENFAWTVHPWSACNYYGAYYGLEPVGLITPRGYRERLFGTMAYGNNEFHTYGIFDVETLDMKYEDKDWEFFIKNYSNVVLKANEINLNKDMKTIGIFYPMDRSIFDGEVPKSILFVIKMLRHNFPVSVICETMILDGALDKLDTLYIMDAEFTRKEVIEKIVDWAKTKGKQIFANGLLKDIELEEVPEFNELFGINKDTEECRGHVDTFIIPNKDFENLSKKDHLYCEKSFMNLDKGAVPLSASREDKALVEIFKKPIGTVYPMFYKDTPNSNGFCRCIMYTGVCDLVHDPEELWTSNGCFEALLKDVAQRSKVKYFDLKEGEVARAMLFGKELVLTETELKLE